MAHASLLYDITRSLKFSPVCSYSFCKLFATSHFLYRDEAYGVQLEGTSRIHFPNSNDVAVRINLAGHLSVASVSPCLCIENILRSDLKKIIKRRSSPL